MITRKLLEAKGACREQVEVFAKAWPDGGPVTPENCLEAVRLGLDLGWAAQHLLKAAALRAYDEGPAWRAYEEARAAALRAYKEARAAALRAYDEAEAPAFYAAWIIDQPTERQEELR